MRPNSVIPDLGFGLGLRAKHYPFILEHWPAVDWFEVISENFMDTDGHPKRVLAQIRERYPVVMHGVSMSIGTVDPLNFNYLKKLKKLIHWLKPAWISDHLCWTGVAHANSHDLLPIPYTEEALEHVILRINQVQDFLGMPLAIENPSTYLEFSHSQIPEAEFINHIVRATHCNLLLDINNVYVNSFNHQHDPRAYIDALPLDRVIQIHLSGHTNQGTHIIDTHDNRVQDDVWRLYKYVVHKIGHAPNTMVEWDNQVPEFSELLAELNKAKAAAKDAANFLPLPNFYKEQGMARTEGVITLAEMQHHIQDAIVIGKNIDGHLDEWIRSKPTLSVSDQLGVYINAYRARLYNTVVEDYPALKHAMGGVLFEQLINRFIDGVRPDHFNIHRFAAKLPSFMAQHNCDQFLIELCTLETTVSQLADWPETGPLESADLIGLLPEQFLGLVLYPREALALHQFEYQVNAYYAAVIANKNVGKPVHKASYTGIFRHDDIVWRMDFEQEEHQLLSILFDGVSIGRALENFDEQVVSKFPEWMSRWVRNGILANGG